MLGRPVRRARERALVPIASSSHRPPGAKLTRSARRRIVRPPHVHRIVPDASVTAVTKPASSATLRSSSARPSTGPRSGEPFHRWCAAPSEDSGAWVRAGSTLARERAQESATSRLRTRPARRSEPGDDRPGITRDHSSSSVALRCARSPLRGISSPIVEQGPPPWSGSRRGSARPGLRPDASVARTPVRTPWWRPSRARTATSPLPNAGHPRSPGPDECPGQYADAGARTPRGQGQGDHPIHAAALHLHHVPGQHLDAATRDDGALRHSGHGNGVPLPGSRAHHLHRHGRLNRGGPVS